MLQKYRHISFDLDGTLVGTTQEHRHSIVPKIVADLGGKISEPIHIDRFWFEKGRDKIIEEKFRVNPGDFWKLWVKLDTPELRGKYTTPYADSEITIRKLKKMGKLVSIVTGARHNIAKMEIKKLNGAPYDYYLSIFDNKFKEKPHPESLHFALEKLHVKPKETLYIGNSNEDAFYAKNAGIDFLHIDRGEHLFDLREQSVKVIKSLEDLFSI